MSYDDDKLVLLRALRPLEDVLGEIILVGGWAHRLHAHHPLATQEGRLLNTLDADLFITTPTSKGPRREALHAAGFTIRPGGHETPPVTEYLLATDADEFEVEFLAHRQGAEVDRHGIRRVTTRFGDVVAILLPFMDVMAHEPWTCTVEPSAASAPDPRPLTLRVVSPAAYVAHKLMVLKDRPVLKRHQDVRYLYETLRRFAPALSTLHASWSRRSSTKGELKRVSDGRRFLTDSLIAYAADTPDLEGMTADKKHLRLVLDDGLHEIFDPLPR